MSELCLALLTNLLRTTAFLSVTAIVVGVVLKIVCCQSPRVHRGAWCLVLMQGLLFVRVPWSIHSTRQPMPLAVQTEILPSTDEPLSLPSDTGFEFAPTTPDATITAAPPPVIQEPAVQSGISEVFRRHWATLATVVWFGGIVTLVGMWAFRYIRFLRSLPFGEPVPDEWRQEFLDVLGAGSNLAIEPCVTDEVGPLLCRRWGGYAIVFPKSLWNNLLSAQRRAILRHEIGHYQRGDLWKSIAIRLLALPHWFNPFAWFTVRRFDEAAEWACDELAAAQEVSATEFANTLLKICESTRSYGAIVPAARGSSVKQRIGRLISLPSKGDSIMRKSIVFGLIAVFLAAGSLEVRLVADEPQLPVRLPPLTEPDLDEVNVDYAHQMIKDAERAFEATLAAYDAGTVPMEPIYTWSRKWLQATLDITAKRDERLAAYEAHRDRVEQLYKEVHTKFLVGAKGGEADRNYAAKFYLAEANLWLAQQTGKTGAASGVNSDKFGGAQIEVYSITTIDPNTAVKVVQTMLDSAPDLRVMVDPKTNSLVVQAHPAEHAKIRELLGKLDAKRREPVDQVGSKPADPASHAESEPQKPTYHALQFVDAKAILKILRPLLAGQPNVSVSEDARNNALVVSAPQAQREAIISIIKKFDIETLPSGKGPERR